MLVDDDLLRWPGGDHPAGEQHHDVAPGGLLEAVGGHHDAVAGVALLVDDPQDHVAGDDVEARDRLVEQEQRRLLGEALGDERSLALPA